MNSKNKNKNKNKNISNLYTENKNSRGAVSLEILFVKLENGDQLADYGDQLADSR
jgi:hypothetical protein